MKTTALLESMRGAYERLNERERKLVVLLGVVAAVFVLVLPVYLLSSSISSIEEENRRIADLLRELQTKSAEIQQKQAERRAALERYETPAPPLASFLEQRATDVGLSAREVTEQPEKVIGAYTRRNVRLTLPGVSLVPVMRMIESIENSSYPVALERIQLEHYSAGDRYNVQLGVVAYDRNAANGASAAAPASRGGGRAGPPAPP